MAGGALVSGARWLLPDLLLEAGEFREGRAVQVDPESGRIAAVADARRLTGGRERRPGGGTSPGETDAAGREDRARGDSTVGAAPPVERLSGRALLPGFVNAHSHAFQRIIRGRTQRRPAAALGADFWSWREAMYRAADALSPEDLFAVARFSFVEMLLAGWTAVGEFHYLHRDPDGRPYDDRNELARRVLAGAAAAGIRTTLLDAPYATGGIGEPLRPEQARFGTPDLEEFLAGVAALLDELRSDPMASVGVAPHSVRAVPREWLGPLGTWARERGLPVHMHLCEQPAEVDACRAAYGLGPAELAFEEGLLDPGFTGIHLTHPSGREVRLLGRAGVTACLCPTTERDLGDGIPPAAELLEAGVGFALGTDSQALVDPFEEMRLVEYHERLRTLGRVRLAEPGPDGTLGVGGRLLRFASEGGARSLGLEAGAVRPGALADLAAVDLRHRSLAGWTRTTLPDLLAFSVPPEVVRDVWVGGVRRVEDGTHPEEGRAAEAFREVAARLA